MKFRSFMTAICVMATANIVSAAPFAYIANSGSSVKSVSKIDTADNTIKATVNLPGTAPYAYSVAVGASGQYAYVGIQGTNEVDVIDTATNSIVKRIGLGSDSPGGLAVNAAETRLYVASNMSNTLIVIDISGAGAQEVGRVAVEDAAVSNPEGVVLSPNGLKAYVANSTKGTIAEIALDESINSYTRTTLISLVNNAQPMGLTISSDGAKLYAASLNGKASLIDTANRTVTELPLAIGNDFATGNLSVAITPNNSKIYAPSNVINNMYVINGTNNAVTALGGLNSLLDGPWGSAVTPDGTKLYVAMNASNNVRIFDTSTNLEAAGSPISLAPNAHPTSLGNFIGPNMPWSINASAGTNCNILPSGTVLVANDSSRRFNITPTTGACEVFIDDLPNPPKSVGFPSVYTFNNVIADGHTINAVQKAGIFYALTASWISSTGGYLVSTPVGINLNSPMAQFESGTNVSITADANHAIAANSWTGACAGTVGSTCTLLVDGAKSFGATVNPKGAGGPMWDVTQGSYIAYCYEAADGDSIKISTDITSLDTTGFGTKKLTLSSQWKSGDYSSKDTYKAMVLTIKEGTVVANDLTL